MIAASLSKLVYCIQIETDPSLIASLYKAVVDTLCVVGVHALTPELTNGLMDGTKHQLQNMAEKRKRRAARGAGGDGGVGGGVAGGPGGPGDTTIDSHTQHAPSPQQRREAQDEDDEDEMALMEEMEEFALEDMEKTLKMLDGQHPLLIAVASVRELGSHRYPPWEGEVELGGPEDVEIPLGRGDD